MNSIDPMVSALIALCKEEGGEKFVADKAVVSAENLLQITKGVKLPSGNPRGVGPGLRAKITKAYPNWLEITTRAQNEIGSPPKQINSTTYLTGVHTTTNTGDMGLANTLSSLSDQLAQLDPATRAAAGGLLSALAQQPDNPALLASITALLTPAAFAEKARKSA